MNNTLKSKIKNRKGNEYIAFVFFVLYIYLMFSLWFLSIELVITTMLIVGLIILYMCITKRKITLNKGPLLIFFLMVIQIALSGIVNRKFGVLDTTTIVQIFITTMLVCSFTKGEFERHYSDAMCLIAILSMVGFYCSLLFPSIANKFPYATADKWIGNYEEMNLRNLFISVVHLNVNYPRNWGIFYEPGMYAFFINVALYFSLIEQKQKKVSKIIILTIAQITTMSTNGLFSLILIYFLFLIQKNHYSKYLAHKYKIYEKEDRKMKRTLLLFFFIVLIFVTLFFISIPKRWEFFISKIGQLGKGVTGGSGYERMEAARIAVEAVSRNPLFGLSVTGVTELANGRITTFTPIQWFASYGLFYGLFCNCCFLFYGYDKRDNVIVNVLKCITLFSMVISQNMTTNGVVLAMIFYKVGKIFRRLPYDFGYHSCL